MSQQALCTQDGQRIGAKFRRAFSTGLALVLLTVLCLGPVADVAAQSGTVKAQQKISYTEGGFYIRGGLYKGRDRLRHGVEDAAHEQHCSGQPLLDEKVERPVHDERYGRGRILFPSASLSTASSRSLHGDLGDRESPCSSTGCVAQPSNRVHVLWR